MKLCLRLSLLAVVLLACVLAASAASLWSEQSRSLFTDTKAHGVGDLLTIVISQSSTATTTAKHNTTKSTDANAAAGTGLFSGFTGLSMKATRNSDGGGSSQSSTSFVDQLEVKVIAVLPNGNLRVEGSRVIKLEKDEMLLTFSGVVRTQDVAQDNTVSSVLVAEQRLVTRGNGPIAEKQRPGLVYRLLSFLW